MRRLLPLELKEAKKRGERIKRCKNGWYLIKRPYRYWFYC
jgi:hypothetical protein